MIPNTAHYLNRETRRLGVQRDIPEDVQQRAAQERAIALAARAAVVYTDEMKHHNPAPTVYRRLRNRR